MAIQDYEAFRSEGSERLKYQLEFAQSLIRSLVLVNGGAIVALYTFIGNTRTEFNPHVIWWAFGTFVLGLFLTLSSAFAAYLAQAEYLISIQHQTWNAQLKIHGAAETYDTETFWKTGQKYQLWATVAAGTGLVAFAVGAGIALAGVM